jgi:AcrR family transcriptional regulator
MSSSAVAERPARRTQAERSADTQRQLLEATLACLIDQGYARTTTAEIEARAGASRGARLHHYPTKAVLVSAAVEQLYAGIAERYDAAMKRVAPDADRFRAGFRLLWATYVDPAYAAVLELCIAARTDPELRTRLRELSERHHQLVRHQANAYFPNLANREANGLLETLQATLSGLALRRLVNGDRGEDEHVLDLIERMVARTFYHDAAELSGTELPTNEAARTEPSATENEA